MSEGTASGLYPGEESSTDLAQRLSLPRPPDPGSAAGRIGCASLIGSILYLAVVSVAQVLSVFIIAGVVVLLALAVYVAKVVRAKRYASWLARDALPAMRRVWNELYYCFRDDIVFRGDLPARWAPAAEMAEFIQHENPPG